MIDGGMENIFDIPRGLHSLARHRCIVLTAFAKQTRNVTFSEDFGRAETF